MVTLFTTHKAFDSQIVVMQRNGIQSWTLLRNTILFGNNPGPLPLFRKCDIMDILNVSSKEYVTPRVGPMLNQADRSVKQDQLCQVNAAIKPRDDFSSAVEEVRSRLTWWHPLRFLRTSSVLSPLMLLASPLVINAINIAMDYGLSLYVGIMAHRQGTGPWNN